MESTFNQPFGSVVCNPFLKHIVFIGNIGCSKCWLQLFFESHIKQILTLFKLLISRCYHIGFDRCWWRMLKTKCVGDKFKMLVTVTNIHNLFTLVNKITMSLTTRSRQCHHHIVVVLFYLEFSKCSSLELLDKKYNNRKVRIPDINYNFIRKI